MKTLAIRLEDELHAQLVALSSLGGTSLVEEIREAIEGHVERKSAQGDLADKAASALEEIDRDAASRRAAIQALFGKGSATGESPKGRPGRKAEAPASEGEA